MMNGEPTEHFHRTVLVDRETGRNLGFPGTHGRAVWVCIDCGKLNPQIGDLCERYFAAPERGAQ